MLSSSTLRRLAADHAMLHSELPPYYLFDPSSTDLTVDDLTRLTVFMTGPNGTPYSQGLWKLSLKIPDSYPAAPPTATFQTRIWHPNVEENTGSVCVDTLKKDWEPKLTLRDVLIVRALIAFCSMASLLIWLPQTVSCLLLQPNPDSALNSTAGHLLQDDYDSFARQARLMTSIHARIPLEFRKDVLAAKSRGETDGTFAEVDADQRPGVKGKSPTSSSSVVMKKQPERVFGTQSAPSNRHQAMECQGPAGEDEDDTSASKENHFLQSVCPGPASSSQRPSVTKRPLSEVVQWGHAAIDVPCLGISEQDVVTNAHPLECIAFSDSSRRGSHLLEKCTDDDMTPRGLQGRGGNGVGSASFEERPTKRVCSNSGKDNLIDAWRTRGSNEEQLSLAIKAASKVGIPTSKNARLAYSSRVGLRRL